MAATQEQLKLAEELLFSGEKKASFAKQLYFGRFDASRVFPFPEMPAREQADAQSLLARVRSFANAEIDPVAIDRNADIPRSVIEGLGKLGVLGMTVPKEYGGLGLSQHAYCLAVESVARRCGATAVFINAHESIGLKALLLFGTEKQKRDWLPALARGEKLAAFSLTEPEAGSDAANIQTRAVYDPARKVYRINGTKQWTTNGSIAGVLTLMARTELDTPQGKKDKITAFLITPDMPGFKVTAPALEKVGIRGTRTTNLAFENMEVPEQNILGQPGGGLKLALTVLDYGRTTFGASCSGIAKELLALAADHAKNRRQFGRPLAGFALIKKKLATMAALSYAMDASAYLTAGMIDREEKDIMLETAILKVFASESLWTIVYEAMQILGGRSFFTDAPYERMMRDARLNMIGEGANEVLRAFIGAVGMRDVGMELKDLLDSYRNPALGLAKSAGFGLVRLARFFSIPRVPVRSPRLRKEALMLGYAIRRLGFAVLRLLITHRENIVEKQMLLDRGATAAIAIYTATAVLSKLDSELGSGRSQNLAVGKLYCQLAFESIQSSLATLFRNGDDRLEAVSDELTRG